METFLQFQQKKIRQRLGGEHTMGLPWRHINHSTAITILHMQHKIVQAQLYFLRHEDIFFMQGKFILPQARIRLAFLKRLLKWQA